jgi:phosphoglycolate phosphatase-like HAD superfamily hydrolase
MEPQLQKPYFVGVDSDGTAFDSMEIKHKQVFQPVAIEMWGLQPLEKEFREVADFVNLYSTHRGVNRFQGLVMVFERMRQISGWRDRVPNLPDPSALREFVLSGRPLSVGALEEYAAANSATFAAEAAVWSRRSDELYAHITREEGNPPFPLVRECLERAAQAADVWIISSSSCSGLEHDWGGADLLGPIGHIAGQEEGDKKAQLDLALRVPRAAEHALMIGDAPGDLDAATAAGALFFPVLPGRERQSWQDFHHEGLDRFLAGTFAGDYQNRLLSGFQSVLHEDAPWP